jgi:hypothetical protein
MWTAFPSSESYGGSATPRGISGHRAWPAATSGRSRARGRFPRSPIASVPVGHQTRSNEPEPVRDAELQGRLGCGRESVRFQVAEPIKGLESPLRVRSAFWSRLRALERLAVPPGRSVDGTTSAVGARSRAAAAPSFAGPLHQPGQASAGTDESRSH